MGWMHDTLAYMTRDPLHRRHHQNEITFSIWYAFSENFVLPLSHDEVVYGKRSLLSKMPGDDWQRFANLRLLLGYMWLHPGKKLLFMGGEFGQWREWNHDQSLDWHLLALEPHQRLQQWVRDLNRLYRAEPALHVGDCRAEGFEWIDSGDAAHSVLSFLRRGGDGKAVVIVCNFTPVPRHNYRVGVPGGGFWREVLNSDAICYGGSGQGNLGGIDAAPTGAAGRFHSINAALPPLGVVVFKGN
jgi:1,4-alpha-glucan branching enzyme